MGRRPIGKKAMTAAERQQRVRKRQKKEKLATGRKAARQRSLMKQAETYMPYPPGITYWHTLKLLTNKGEREIWQPRTRPLAAVKGDIEDSDIIELLRALKLEARRRGLREPAEETPPSDGLAKLSSLGAGVMCWGEDPPETWTVIPDAAA